MDCGRRHANSTTRWYKKQIHFGLGVPLVRLFEFGLGFVEPGNYLAELCRVGVGAFLGIFDVIAGQLTPQRLERLRKKLKDHEN
jgi:hypothetical protein